MKRVFICMILMGGLFFSPKKAYVSVAANESKSQASIRFIKGDFVEEGTKTGKIKNIESDSFNSVSKEITLPQTGEKCINYSELMGVSIISCTLLLVKIKKIRKEDLT